MYLRTPCTHRSTNKRKFKNFAGNRGSLSLPSCKRKLPRGISSLDAEVAHLVEHDLAKVGVAGSSPVFRSKENPNQSVWIFCLGRFINCVAPVVELVDTQDLKSCDPKRSYGFDSRLGHKRDFFTNSREAAQQRAAFFLLISVRYVRTMGDKKPFFLVRVHG